VPEAARAMFRAFRPVVGNDRGLQVLRPRVRWFPVRDAAHALRLHQEPRRPGVALRRTCSPGWPSGEIKAHVGQRVALRDAAAAHHDLEARRTIGATVPAPLAAPGRHSPGTRATSPALQIRVDECRQPATWRTAPIFGGDHFAVLETASGSECRARDSARAPIDSRRR